MTVDSKAIKNDDLLFDNPSGLPQINRTTNGGWYNFTVLPVIERFRFTIDDATVLTGIDEYIVPHNARIARDYYARVRFPFIDPDRWYMLDYIEITDPAHTFQTIVVQEINEKEIILKTESLPSECEVEFNFIQFGIK